MVLFERLRPQDIDETAALLSASFLDNPCYAYMHPRVRTRSEDLHAFFVRNLHWRSSLGLTWVARERGMILATGSLEPPGGVGRPASEVLTHWVLPTLRVQGAHTVARTVHAERFFARELRTLAARYWHVHAVAVVSQVRGRGYGASLMEVLLEALPSPRLPLLLATQRESNLRFYARFGFEVTHQAKLASPRGRGTFTSWFMRQA